MRILFLHQFDLDLAGGSGTYLRLVHRGLTAAGHDVEVVAARRPDRYGCTTYALPFDFTLTFGPQRRPGERTFDDFSMPELRALAARAADSAERQAFEPGRRPDLLLVNHISLHAEVARQLRARRGVPYRVISYGTDTQLLIDDARYLQWLRPAVGGAESVFAIGAFVAGQVRSLFPSAPVSVLGGGVDTTVFRPAAQDGALTRIAYVGRLVTEKGVWTLLDALRRLPGVVLDVVGEGPLSGPLREAAAGIPHATVEFHGYLPAEGVRSVLARSAALVVPSVWAEPLGLVILEAMACGVPVVATAVGGIPEIVQHDRNGLLVEPEDPAGLAGAIAAVLGDPALRRRLRDHCVRETRISSHTDLAASLLS